MLLLPSCPQINALGQQLRFYFDLAGWQIPSQDVISYPVRERCSTLRGCTRPFAELIVVSCLLFLALFARHDSFPHPDCVSALDSRRCLHGLALPLAGVHLPTPDFAFALLLHRTTSRWCTASRPMIARTASTPPPSAPRMAG